MNPLSTPPADGLFYVRAPGMKDWHPVRVIGARTSQPILTGGLSGSAIQCESLEGAEYLGPLPSPESLMTGVFEGIANADPDHPFPWMQDVAPIPPRKILEMVHKYTFRTVDDIKGTGRTADLVRSRNLAIWLIRCAHPGWSLKEIGELFSGRDHRTIMHSLANARADYETDRRFHSLANQVAAHLKLNLCPEPAHE